MAALPAAPTGCRWESELQPCRTRGCLLPPASLPEPVPVPPGDRSLPLHPALRLWEHPRQPWVQWGQGCPLSLGLHGHCVTVAGGWSQFERFNPSLPELLTHTHTAGGMGKKREKMEW